MVSTATFQSHLTTFSQFALLALVIASLGIEEGAGLPQVIGWVVLGWTVHTSAPPRWQGAVFVALSVVVLVARLGADALWVLVPALVLAELTHLAAPARVRVGALLLLAAGLGAVRGGLVDAPWPPLALAVLGSMFMFRAALVVADPGPADTSRWTRWGYFLQWPNTVFLLYPIVDWGAWRRPPVTPAYALHQRGLRWMTRGVAQLLLYRLAYQIALPADWQIVDAASALQWIFAGYALYLRISGEFHLIVGSLLMFGRELPETHRLYFLASGFSDYWRRINIYWKDFVEKMVFYPIFLRLRRTGVPQPLALSVLITFGATWVLHSWQWFWLRGEPLLSGVDAGYWGLLGVLVAINAWWESSRPRRRGVRTAPWRQSAQTVVMFVVLAVLWSFWGSASVEEWADRMALLADGSAAPLWLLGLMVVLTLLGAAAVRLGETPPVARALAAWQADREGYVTLGGVAALAALAVVLAIPGELPPPIAQARAALARERLNEQDYLAKTRGYYEDLQPRGSLLGEAWQPQRGFPPGWVKLTDSSFTRSEETSLMYELVPGATGWFHGAPLSVNAHGLRDQDYLLEKPPGTMRIALLGASIEMGGGVKAEDVFEQRAEARIARELAASEGGSLEILNFAVDGYTLLHRAVQYERSVRAFQPDVVLYAVHRNDGERALRTVARLARMGRPIPNDRLAALAEQYDLANADTEDEGIRRILRHEREAVALLYHQVASLVAADGAKLVWLLVPQVREIGQPEVPEAEDWQRALAIESGMLPISLASAYGERSALDIQQAPWDDHPNTVGHRLLGDRLAAELRVALPRLR